MVLCHDSTKDRGKGVMLADHSLSNGRNTKAWYPDMNKARGKVYQTIHSYVHSYVYADMHTCVNTHAHLDLTWSASCSSATPRHRTCIRAHGRAHTCVHAHRIVRVDVSFLTIAFCSATNPRLRICVWNAGSCRPRYRARVHAHQHAHAHACV